MTTVDLSTPYLIEVAMYNAGRTDALIDIYNKELRNANVTIFWLCLSFVSALIYDDGVILRAEWYSAIFSVALTLYLIWILYRSVMFRSELKTKILLRFEHLTATV